MLQHCRILLTNFSLLLYQPNRIKLLYSHIHKQGAPSPTPIGPPPTNFTVTFKSYNVFAQQFDSIGNAPPTPEPEEPTPQEEENHNENAEKNIDENSNESNENRVNIEALVDSVENTDHSEHNEVFLEKKEQQEPLEKGNHDDDDADVIIPITNNHNSDE